MSSIQRTSLLRLGAEFLLIFFSVVLAFIADDWRTKQNETRAAEASLELVLRDLRQDLVGLRRLEEVHQTWNEAALELVSVVEGDATRDELSQAADVALRWGVFRPSLVGYQGLQQTGRLRWVRDLGLHDALVFHYDETLAYLERLKVREDGAAFRANELAERHFRSVPADPPKVNRLVAISSAAEMREDREFLGALSNLVARRRWLNYRVSGGGPDDIYGYTGNFIVFTEQLVAAIEDYLSGES